MATLVNGNFNGGTWRKCFDGGSYPELDLPNGWTAFWDDVRVGENGQQRARPESSVIGRVPPYLDPVRIPEGMTYALKMFTFMKPHLMGIYQKVTGLIVGQKYRISAQYHAWCSQGDDGNISDQATSYGMYAQIGVEFAGWTNKYGYIDPARSNHDLFSWGPQEYIFDNFKEVSYEFTATSTAATIALMSCSKWGSKHSDAYWGNVQLTEVGTVIDPPVPPDDDDDEPIYDDGFVLIAEALSDVAVQLGRIADKLGM